MSVVVRSSVFDDIAAVALRMREDDVREAQAMGHSPSEALTRGYNWSKWCMTVLVNDVPAAMFGVGSHDGIGIVWALGTDDLTHRAVVEVSRVHLPRLEAEFEYLGNLVDARNEVHVGWLKRLGFEILGRTEKGPDRREFLVFGKRSAGAA